MQRAAAIAPKPSPSSDDGPLAKRQKLSNGSPVVRQAADVEGAQRLGAQNSPNSETNWVLQYRQPRKEQKPTLAVVSAGYNVIDSPRLVEAESVSDDESKTTLTGRRVFGDFNRKPKVSSDLRPFQ